MIIGIAGTLGSGKGTVVDYLKTKGFAHYSVSGNLKLILDERGLPAVRENLSTLADELANEYTGGALEYLRNKASAINDKDYILESIHRVQEAEYVRSVGGLILGIDADPKVRYERAVKRKEGVKDEVTFEQFLKDIEREEEGKGSGTPNIKAVIETADYVIENNGTLEELQEKVEEFLKACAPRTIEKSAWFCIKERRVLFARSKHVDRFYLPGGKREEGETDEEALVREIKEETMVELIPETIKLAAEFSHHAHGKPANVSVALKGYFAEYNGELEANEEIAELAWFNTQDQDKLYGVGLKAVDWLYDKGYID